MYGYGILFICSFQFCCSHFGLNFRYLNSSFHRYRPALFCGSDPEFSAESCTGAPGIGFSGHAQCGTLIGSQFAFSGQANV